MNALGPVVVWVSDAENSDRGLDWAAAWAVETGRLLKVVHATGRPRGRSTSEGATQRASTEASRRLVEAAAHRVASTHSGLLVTTSVDVGDPSVVLLAQAQEASVLVLGAPGGAARLARRDSLSRSVMRQAECPVVVVREPPVSGAARRVVLGVDGTAASRRAAEFAFHYASATDLPVVVMHCSLERLARGSSVLALLSRSDQHGPTAEEELLIAETLGGLAEEYPDVEHRAVHLSGLPADELVHASAAAQLVVLGARHRHGLHRLLHRSVSIHVSGHAHCPVAVVSAT